MKRDIIFFSTADWDNPFWTNKQHLASALADEGFRVLYIESAGLRRPTARAADLRRMWRRLVKGLSGLKRPREGLWVWSPLVVPLQSNPLVKAVNDGVMTAALRRHILRLRFRDPLFWTYNPMSLPLARSLGLDDIVYHCVDDLSAIPGAAADAVLRAESELAGAARMVFTTSPTLQRRCEAAAPGRCRCLPNVVDFDHFSRAMEPGDEPAELASVERPRIGFVGALSEYKVDFDLIAALAARRPQWQWVLVGKVGEGQPGTSAQRLRAPNIHLVGPRPYALVPRWLAAFDAAVIPAPLNDYTRSMFPMKFFEYLAAGRPVVATRLPALVPYASVCRLASSADEFLAGIEDALSGRIDTAGGVELARRHTWKWRTGEMLRLLDL
ncbi:MAG TPA: glycosyltransferase family 1 protein [Deltaproteobacteria bacterium]|nr:glycosyltransferase family 1 protein [Deltaproteobacteria bacterium]